ncbi:hypothetical protein BGX30_002424 [Mortierella sp. GBA39]|nr:hypothetical protein BGX30_002424 [Mortierella sp. GBA39]
MAFEQFVGAISLHYYTVLPAHHGLFDQEILQSDRDWDHIDGDSSDETGSKLGYRPFHDGGKVLPFNILVETWADSPLSYDPNLKAVLIGANKEEGYGLDSDFGERTLKTWLRLLNSFVPFPELVHLYEAACGIPQVDEDVSRVMAEHLGDTVFHYLIERAVNALVQVKQARGDEFSLERYHLEIPTQATLNSHPNPGSMHGGELLFLFNPPMNETVFIPSELSAALEVQKRRIAFAYQQPVLSDDSKAAERDEAIVLKKENKVEVWGRGGGFIEKFVGLWDAAPDIWMKDIQASLDASETKED